VFSYGCDLGQFSRSPSRLCKGSVWWSWFVIVNHLQLNKNVQKPYAPMHKYHLRQLNIVTNYPNFNWIYIKNWNIMFTTYRGAHLVEFPPPNLMHIAFLPKQNITFTSCWGKANYNWTWTLNSFIYIIFKSIDMFSLPTNVRDEFQHF
jgi:hypothetical protein